MANQPRDVDAELSALLQETFQSDPRRRTYLRLALEGLAKAALKGNVEACKLIIRHANIAKDASKRKRNSRSKRTAQ